MKIGVAGLGKMGSALAERVIELGHEVAVWNRTPARAAPLVEKGAAQAASPRALAERSDAILVMVLDDAAQAAVYGGSDGLASASLAGRLVIDMSTVSPESSGARAAAVTAAGGHFLECPVGGTVTPARTGKLLGLAGGSADAYAAARPLLDTLCRRVEHVGPAGAGAAMKLAINLPLAAYWEALGEALSIAGAGGVSPELAADLLADSSGAIQVAKPRMPMVLDAIAGKAGPAPAFDLSSMRKDLALMVDAATRRGFTAPVAAAALAAFEEAAADGWGTKDAATEAAWRYLRSRT